MNFRKIIAWTIIAVVGVFALAALLTIAQEREGRIALLVTAGLVAVCVAVAWALYEVFG